MAHRVLFILPDLGGGGAEAVVLTLLGALDHTRFDPMLYLLKDQGPLRNRLPLNIRYSAAAAPGQRIRENLGAVWRDLRKELTTAQIIVGCLELDATYIAWLLGAFTHKPVLGWVHTPLQEYLNRVPAWHRWVVRWIYPRLARVIFPSVGARSSMMRVAALDAARSLIIPNPLDLQWIQQQAQNDLPVEALPMLSRPMILAMGRLEPEKNYSVLIRAFAEARRDHLTANLVILGEGPERGKLQSLIEVEGVSDAVYLPGFVPNPYAFLKRAILFVHPSQVEGFGMALLEAMTLGVPVVAAQNAVGPQELLDHGKYGRLISMSDPEILERCIVSLLANRDQMDTLQKMGPIRAANFAAEQVVRHWQQLFESLVC